MRFEDVVQIASKYPYMTPTQGRQIYEHVLSTRPREILELGTARGTSAAYMAAALDELDAGHLTTLDKAERVQKPPPEEDLFQRLPSLRARIDFVRTPDSSYVWWLKNKVEELSDDSGNCTPYVDFCYLDGAHDFTIDGLAVVLIEKLLRPDGWLLLDDLTWNFATSDVNVAGRGMSEEELRKPHVRAVFDLIVRQHPAFSGFREQDAEWGWARKSPGLPRTYSLETTRSFRAVVFDNLARARLRLRTAMLLRWRHRGMH